MESQTKSKVNPEIKVLTTKSSKELETSLNELTTEYSVFMGSKMKDSDNHYQIFITKNMEIVYMCLGIKCDSDAGFSNSVKTLKLLFPEGDSSAERFVLRPIGIIQSENMVVHPM